MKLEFRCEDFVLTFDKDHNPILSTDSDVRDYQILRNIFLNPKIMKTSTLFCGCIPPTERDFHILIYNLLKRNDTFDDRYCLKKVLTSNNNVALIGGLLEKDGLLMGKKIFELVGFATEEYYNKGYGIFSGMDIINNFDYKDNCIIASVWTGYAAQIRFLLKNNFIFLKEEIKKNHGEDYIINVYFKMKVEKNLMYEIKTDHQNLNINLDKCLVTKSVNFDSYS